MRESQLVVETVEIDSITPDPVNARKHDQRNLGAIAESLSKFGQRRPLVVTHRGVVIAGNGTLEAAKSLGWKQIAVTRTPKSWPEEKARAYALADNRTAELAAWDQSVLSKQLVELEAADWDMEALGFESNKAAGSIVENPDEIPTSAPAKTINGDVWLLGPHRLLCGDCREPSDVDKLLNGARINLAFTSPPYAEQRTYDESSGFKPIPPDEYVEWFHMVQANVAANLADDGSWFVNIKAAAEGLDRSLYVMDLVVAHARDWGWHFADEFCWERIGVPKQPVLRFKNQWEPIYQFARDRWKFRPDNVRHASEDAIIAYGPGRGNTSWADPNSNVVSQGGKGDMFAGQRAKKRNSRGATSWQGKQGQPGGAFPDYEDVKSGFAYPGNRLPNFNGSHEATGHTAAFPVGLPEFFVKAYTDEGDTVFDPFMGSGSTLLAAHKQNRIAYGTEISPAYCDIICARFQKATGIIPIAESTGNTHDFLNDDNA